MSAPLVSIIIVNYNTPDLVYDCLESIEKHMHVPYEVIVVENSTKSFVTQPELHKYPHTRLVEPKPGRGYGGGNNAGAALATGTYLWLLNSDTLLIDGSVSELIALFENNPEIGIVSPYLYNDTAATQLQQDFCANFQTLSRLILRKTRPQLHADTPTNVDIVVGAALMIRRSLYERLGGFDERIFMYMEDDDLCLRAVQAGFITMVTPLARIIHLQGKSIAANSQRKKYYYKSQDYYWKKHHGVLAATVMKILRFPIKVRNTRH